MFQNRANFGKNYGKVADFCEIPSETRDLLRISQENCEWTRKFAAKSASFCETSEFFLETFLKTRGFAVNCLHFRRKAGKMQLFSRVLRRNADFQEKLQLFVAVCFVGFCENLVCQLFEQKTQKMLRFDSNFLRNRAKLGKLVIFLEELPGFRRKNAVFADFLQENEEDRALRAVLSRKSRIFKENPRFFEKLSDYSRKFAEIVVERGIVNEFLQFFRRNFPRNLDFKGFL